MEDASKQYVVVFPNGIEHSYKNAKAISPKALGKVFPEAAVKGLQNEEGHIHVLSTDGNHFLDAQDPPGKYKAYFDSTIFKASVVDPQDVVAARACVASFHEDNNNPLAALDAQNETLGIGSASLGKLAGSMRYIIALNNNCVYVAIDASESSLGITRPAPPYELKLAGFPSGRSHALVSELASALPIPLLLELCVKDNSSLPDASDCFEIVGANVEGSTANNNYTEDGTSILHTMESDSGGSAYSIHISTISIGSNDGISAGLDSMGAQAGVAASAIESDRSSQHHGGSDPTNKPTTTSRASRGGLAGLFRRKKSTSRVRRLVFTGQSLSGCVAHVAALLARQESLRQGLGNHVYAVAFSSPNCLSPELGQNLSGHGLSPYHLTIANNYDALPAVFDLISTVGAHAELQTMPDLEHFMANCQSLFRLQPGIEEACNEILRQRPSIEEYLYRHIGRPLPVYSPFGFYHFVDCATEREETKTVPSHLANAKVAKIHIDEVQWNLQTLCSFDLLPRLDRLGYTYAQCVSIHHIAALDSVLKPSITECFLISLADSKVELVLRGDNLDAIAGRLRSQGTALRTIPAASLSDNGDWVVEIGTKIPEIKAKGSPSNDANTSSASSSSPTDRTISVSKAIPSHMAARLQNCDCPVIITDSLFVGSEGHAVFVSQHEQHELRIVIWGAKPAEKIHGHVMAVTDFGLSNAFLVTSSCVSSSEIPPGAMFYNLLDEALLKTVLLRGIFYNYSSLVMVGQQQEARSCEALLPTLVELEKILLHTNRLQDMLQALAPESSSSRIVETVNNAKSLADVMVHALPVLRNIVQKMRYICCQYFI